jgi:aminoglycoside phosphotransferase (APT) family kinase protein
MDVPDAREIAESTLADVVALVDPDWDLQDATVADRGFCSVYRLAVDADGAIRTLYLKASPDGEAWSIPTEARLQAVLRAHTSIPVPEIVGAVDDHPDLPTPCYCMTALPGAELPYERVARLDDDALRRLARGTGAHLGELHSVTTFDAFGHVGHDGPALTGERPSGDPATLTVGDPRDWPTALRDYADRELDRHADSRFADLTPDLERWVDERIAALDGPFEAVMGRNDHGLHNLLVDPDTGEITAMLDWGYTLVVPAAFDFEFAVYLYSGSFLAGLADVPDRRSLVREAMLDGYRSTADRPEAVAEREPLYEMLAMVRIMNDFHHLDLPDGSEVAVMERIRTDVRAVIGA